MAHARMLTYLLLRGTPSAQLQVTPVGARVAQPRSVRMGGALLLLESEPSTAQAREDASQPDRYRNHLPDQRFDMLTAQVPGTDLILGMSRRLYAACRQLADAERIVATELETQTPMPFSDPDSEAPDFADLERERWRTRRDELYWQRARSQRRLLTDRILTAYGRGAQAEWEDLIDTRPRVRTEPPAGYLEAATSDTYLAVHRRIATTTI
jgi:hypothetical protein